MLCIGLITTKFRGKYIWHLSTCSSSGVAQGEMCQNPTSYGYVAVYQLAPRFLGLEACDSQ